MGIPHLVRVGLFGQIGRFSSTDRRIYARATDVICRTERGLEVGNVLGQTGNCDGIHPDDLDGELLRKVTPDDRLIITRIEKFRDRAFKACSDLIENSGLAATLVEVEHLFDGQSLYFHFLGNVPDEIHSLTEQLAATYETKVKFKKFTETLAEGCGPNCGTQESSCGDSCGSCAIRSACKTNV